MVHKAYSVRSTVFLQSLAVWTVIWSTEWHAKPTAFASRSLTKPCRVSGYLIMAHKAYTFRSTVFGKATPGDQLLDIVMAYKAYSVRSTVFLKSLAGCQVTWYGHAGNARKTVIWPVPDVKQGILNNYGFSAKWFINSASKYPRPGMGAEGVRNDEGKRKRSYINGFCSWQQLVHDKAAEQALSLLNTMITPDSWTRKTGTTA